MRRNSFFPPLFYPLSVSQKFKKTAYLRQPNKNVFVRLLPKIQNRPKFSPKSPKNRITTPPNTHQHFFTPQKSPSATPQIPSFHPISQTNPPHPQFPKNSNKPHTYAKQSEVHLSLCSPSPPLLKTPESFQKIPAKETKKNGIPTPSNTKITLYQHPTNTHNPQQRKK